MVKTFAQLKNLTCLAVASSWEADLKVEIHLFIFKCLLMLRLGMLDLSFLKVCSFNETRSCCFLRVFDWHVSD